MNRVEELQSGKEATDRELEGARRRKDEKTREVRPGWLGTGAACGSSYR